MTRTLLTILAVVEGALGMFALVTAANMLFTHGTAMAVTFLPVFAVAALLLLAGAAIFLRRPWSYYVHIVAVVLAGITLGLNLGTFVGPSTEVWLVAVVLITVGVTVIFFLPPVRRYFGV